ncbi:MAG: SEL1-like repeat protein, partial [Phenylobacterium sp.]|nr:SEL1-like repeat protein [Phenylobacterium sp.]
IAALRVRALRDDPEAQVRLGQAYAAGDDAPQDFAEAATWMELAAGNPKATEAQRAQARTALASLSRRRAADRNADVVRFARADGAERGGTIILP